jgi:hypothetical protein
MENTMITEPCYVVTEEPDAYYVVSLLSKAKKPYQKTDEGLRMATEFAENLNKRSEEYRQQLKLREGK